MNPPLHFLLIVQFFKKDKSTITFTCFTWTYFTFFTWVRFCDCCIYFYLRTQASLWLSKLGLDTRICPPLVEIGLGWRPKLGMDMSPRPHAHRRACTVFVSGANDAPKQVRKLIVLDFLRVLKGNQVQLT